MARPDDGTYRTERPAADGGGGCHQVYFTTSLLQYYLSVDCRPPLGMASARRVVSLSRTGLRADAPWRFGYHHARIVEMLCEARWADAPDLLVPCRVRIAHAWFDWQTYPEPAGVLHHDVAAVALRCTERPSFRDSAERRAQVAPLRAGLGHEQASTPYSELLLSERTSSLSRCKPWPRRVQHPDLSRSSPRCGRRGPFFRAPRLRRGRSGGLRLT